MLRKTRGKLKFATTWDRTRVQLTVDIQKMSLFLALGKKANQHFIRQFGHENCPVYLEFPRLVIYQQSLKTKLIESLRHVPML